VGLARNPQAQDNTAQAAHCDGLKDLATATKSALNPRLRMAPGAEGFTWLAPLRRRMTATEGACADIISSWSLGGGERWAAMARVSFRQLAAGIGLQWGPGTARTVDRALDGLLNKGIIRRIWGGSGRMPWYRLALIDQMLDRPHLYHDDEDVDRDAVNDVVTRLADAEAEGERLKVLAAGKQHLRRPPSRPTVSNQAPGGVSGNGQRGVSRQAMQVLAAPQQQLSRTPLTSNSHVKGLSALPADLLAKAQERATTTGEPLGVAAVAILKSSGRVSTG
jgi:hypothetical protein